MKLRRLFVDGFACTLSVCACGGVPASSTGQASFTGLAEGGDPVTAVAAYSYGGMYQTSFRSGPIITVTVYNEPAASCDGPWQDGGGVMSAATLTIALVPGHGLDVGIITLVPDAVTTASTTSLTTPLATLTYTDGQSFGQSSLSGTLTLTTATSNELTGTLTALVTTENGGQGTVTGTFDAPACSSLW